MDISILFKRLLENKSIESDLEKSMHSLRETNLKTIRDVKPQELLSAQMANLPLIKVYSAKQNAQKMMICNKKCKQESVIIMKA